MRMRNKEIRLQTEGIGKRGEGWGVREGDERTDRRVREERGGDEDEE